MTPETETTPETRGRKPGGPPSPHPTSLTSKLLSLDPGETMYLPDEMPERGPTRGERNVQSTMTRSKALDGRRFVTVRTIAVNYSPIVATPILAITRTE